jgi:hypothetical protein
LERQHAQPRGARPRRLCRGEPCTEWAGALGRSSRFSNSNLVPYWLRPDCQCVPVKPAGLSPAGKAGKPLLGAKLEGRRRSRDLQGGGAAKGCASLGASVPPPLSEPRHHQWPPLFSTPLRLHRPRRRGSATALGADTVCSKSWPHESQGDILSRSARVSVRQPAHATARQRAPSICARARQWASAARTWPGGGGTAAAAEVELV